VVPHEECLSNKPVRQELGGDDVQFVLGNRRIVVRDGQEVMAEDQNPSQDGVPVDIDGFHTETGLLDLIARENQSTFDLLVQQLRSPMGVVPFVGAGTLPLQSLIALHPPPR
jgi:hypothetical protein